jgi:hypothetical protein
MDEEVLEKLAQRLAGLELAIAVVIETLAVNQVGLREAVCQNLAMMVRDSTDMPDMCRVLERVAELVEMLQKRQPADPPRLRLVQPDEPPDDQR